MRNRRNEVRTYEWGNLIWKMRGLELSDIKGVRGEKYLNVEKDR